MVTYTTVGIAHSDFELKVQYPHAVRPSVPLFGWSTWNSCETCVEDCCSGVFYNFCKSKSILRENI